MGGKTICEYSLLELQDILRRALIEFYERDFYLIEHDLHECSISHRLAVYLECSFPGWHTDCEFNKYGDDPKAAGTATESKRPDIIVHTRGRGGPNLLAVEIKKAQEINEQDRDRTTQFRKELGYKWGVCISISKRQAICEWNGRDSHAIPNQYLAAANVSESE